MVSSRAIDPNLKLRRAFLVKWAQKYIWSWLIDAGDFEVEFLQHSSPRVQANLFKQCFNFLFGDIESRTYSKLGFIIHWYLTKRTIELTYAISQRATMQANKNRKTTWFYHEYLRMGGSPRAVRRRGRTGRWACVRLVSTWRWGSRHSTCGTGHGRLAQSCFLSC